MPTLNWKIIGWIAAAVVAVLIVVAIVVGVEEALQAAGLLGAAAGAAALKNRTDAAKRLLEASDLRVRELQDVPQRTEDAAREEIEALEDDEKVRRGNDLLGGGK